MQANSKRGKDSYFICDGLNKNQLSLAKRVAEKTVELTRVKALLLTINSQYQQQKLQYQQDLTTA